MILDAPETIAEYTDQGWWGTDRLSDLLLRNVARYPDEVALVDPPNRHELAPGAPLRLTFSELQTRVDRLATAFVEAGVGPDDIVMVQLPNVAELVIVYLAVARIGAIISPLAVQFRGHELRHTMSIARPRVFVTTTEFNDFHHLDLVRKLQAEFPSLETIIALGEDLPAGVLSLATILDEPTPNGALDRYLAETEWSANDIYTVCWTSGTEADPKGVPRSHNHWIAIAWFSVDGCEMEERHHLLNPFPMVNMSAVGGMLVPWLLVGGKLVMHHPLNLPVFLQQIQEERIAYTVAPPILMNLLLLKPQLMATVDMSSIKNIGSGSAPLSPWMVSQWSERYNIDVLNIFGSNEGAAFVSSAADIPSPAERASYFPRFGVDGYEWSIRMTPAIRTKLVDPQTKEVITTREHTGEMAIRSPTIFPGYFQRPDLTEKAFDDEGYFYTGDLFEIDGMGEQLNRYRFVGRLKDVIIRGGMTISSEEIEHLIAEHPAVAEVAVVGCPERRLSGEEQIVAVVVLKPEQTLDKMALLDFLKSKDIAIYKMPKRLEIVDALPRNGLSKVLKRALRQQMCASENN